MQDLKTSAIRLSYQNKRFNVMDVGLKKSKNTKKNKKLIH